MKTIIYIRNIFVLIALTAVMSSCNIKTYAEYGHYDIVYDNCPEDLGVKHYRAVGKGFNPNNCNFIVR